MEEQKFPLQSVVKVVGLEKVDSTLSVAQALAAQGEPAGTLVLTCEQTDTFLGPHGYISSDEGGVYFTLLLPPQTAAEKTGLALAQAISRTVENALELKTKIINGGVSVWDKTTRKWKEFASVTCTLEGEQVFLSAGVLLNNPVPRFLAATHTNLKKLLKSETSKELFLDAIMDEFWKYYAFANCER